MPSNRVKMVLGSKVSQPRPSVATQTISVWAARSGVGSNRTASANSLAVDDCLHNLRLFLDAVIPGRSEFSLWALVHLSGRVLALQKRVLRWAIQAMTQSRTYASWTGKCFRSTRTTRWVTAWSEVMQEESCFFRTVLGNSSAKGVANKCLEDV